MRSIRPAPGTRPTPLARWWLCSSRQGRARLTGRASDGVFLPERAPEKVGQGLRFGLTGNAGVRPFVLGREIGGAEQLVPDRCAGAEVLVEVPLLDQMVDAVEAVVGDDPAQDRPEMKPVGRMQIISLK